MPPTAREELSIDQFKKDRNEAMLSMDEKKIRAYMKKYGNQANQPLGDIFWASVHKARTAIPSIPLEERIKSKKWLIERNLSSLDDGEL